MGEGKEQAPKLAKSCDIDEHANPDHHKWLGIKYSHDNDEDTSNTSSLDNSSTSSGSSSSSSSFSSSDMVDDASSSSSNSNGSLFELSELMAHLPIKRGLSKYYEGKSQSFTSLSRVTSIEDLPKKETPYKRKIKSSKSYANGFDAHKPYTLPKAIISKKVPRSYMSSSISFPVRKGSFLSSRPPVIPVQKKF